MVSMRLTIDGLLHCAPSEGGFPSNAQRAQLPLPPRLLL